MLFRYAVEIILDPVFIMLRIPLAKRPEDLLSENLGNLVVLSPGKLEAMYGSDGTQETPNN